MRITIRQTVILLQKRSTESTGGQKCEEKHDLYRLKESSPKPISSTKEKTII